MARLILALLFSSAVSGTTSAQSPELDPQLDPDVVAELTYHTALRDNERAQLLFRIEHPRPRRLYLSGTIALVSSLIIAGYSFGAITGGVDNSEADVLLRLGLPGVALALAGMALFLRAGRLRRRLERRFRDRSHQLRLRLASLRR